MTVADGEQVAVFDDMGMPALLQHFTFILQPLVVFRSRWPP